MDPEEIAVRLQRFVQVRNTVEPRFNEVAGDRPILFVKSRVRYIENLDVTNLRGNEQTVRYIEVIVNDDNPHDNNAVAVKRIQDQGGTLQIVGHVPLTLSRVFHLFLKHGGQISVEVTGKRRNKGIGIEFPATYSMYYNKPSEVKKLIELIRDKEDRAEVSSCL